jgi:hypothetical protein
VFHIFIRFFINLPQKILASNFSAQNCQQKVHGKITNCEIAKKAVIVNRKPNKNFKGKLFS